MHIVCGCSGEIHFSLKEGECCLQDGQPTFTASQKQKNSMHLACCQWVYFLWAEGQNLSRISSSGGIKGVCGDNAPARQMLRDDPRQGHHILAKPPVTHPLPFPQLAERSQRKDMEQGIIL